MNKTRTITVPWIPDTRTSDEKAHDVALAYGEPCSCRKCRG